MLPMSDVLEDRHLFEGNNVYNKIWLIPVVGQVTSGDVIEFRFYCGSAGNRMFMNPNMR
jgi:hypothetical protein